MKMIVKAGIAALASSMMMASPALADIFATEPAPGGIYVSGYGGIAFGGYADFEGVQNPEAGVPGVAGAGANVDVDFSSGRAFGGAVGVHLPFRYLKYFQPRLEIEVGTFRQNVDSGSFNGGNQTFSGTLSGTTVLFNNYSDIIFSEDQVITPYVGGGIGVVFADSDVLYFPGSATAPTFGVVGDDTALYGHIAAGATIKITEQLELYSEARYNRITDATFDRRFLANDGFSAELDDNISNFSVLGGIRFNF